MCSPRSTPERRETVGSPDATEHPWGAQTTSFESLRLHEYPLLTPIDNDVTGDASQAEVKSIVQSCGVMALIDVSFSETLFDPFVLAWPHGNQTFNGNNNDTGIMRCKRITWQF